MLVISISKIEKTAAAKTPGRLVMIGGIGQALAIEMARRGAARIALVDFSEHADLCRFAFSLAKNERDAADLTQQTFLALAKHQKQIRELGKVKTWLFTTLRREFLSNVREHSAHPQVEYRQEDHETAIESNARRFVDSRYLLDALETIEESHRSTLELFYQGDPDRVI
jgi:RNA polymerase sigma factor (sigma-70 family)